MLTNKWARQRRRQNTLTDLTIVPALAIGAVQMWALIPGLSRSGSTISAGRLPDSDFEHAAHGSFLLATPILAGALGELLRLHLGLGGLLVPSLIGGIVAGPVA
ncbi:MAG: undecaprenyl-diphosphate phosphatase [Firmicutes bacterium]|nr:undecaprenyl-diphosphate phosphatase [Bacillota bacterium]